MIVFNILSDEKESSTRAYKGISADAAIKHQEVHGSIKKGNDYIR